MARYSLSVKLASPVLKRFASILLTLSCLIRRNIKHIITTTLGVIPLLRFFSKIVCFSIQCFAATATLSMGPVIPQFHPSLTEFNPLLDKPCPSGKCTCDNSLSSNCMFLNRECFCVFFCMVDYQVDSPIFQNLPRLPTPVGSFVHTAPLFTDLPLFDRATAAPLVKPLLEHDLNEDLYRYFSMWYLWV